MKKLILCLIPMMVGCANMTPSTSYVAADRATKGVSERFFKITSQDHPELAPSIDDLLHGWELRLQNAEGKPTTQPTK